MSSPTSRSLDLLRKDGWTACIVERYNSFSKRYNDLYGFIDVLAMCPRRGFLAVQTTSDSNVTARLAKIAAEPRSLTWIEAGGRIVVHGWKKGGARSEKPGKWICRSIKYPQL